MYADCSQNLEAGNLCIGAAEVDLKPELKLPLAGYGSGARRRGLLQVKYNNPKNRYFNSADGQRDPIRAKVLVVKGSAKPSELIFISLDFVGIEQSFRRDLGRELQARGISDEGLFVSAVHTHSGPGGLSKNPFFILTASDRFVPKFYKEVLQKIVNAVVEARSAIVPGKIQHTWFQTKDLTHNRRSHPERNNPQSHILMWITSSGTVLGALLHFAIHGTVLDEDNLLFSADASGAIERAVETYLQQQFNSTERVAKKPVVAFINGASADTSPNNIEDKTLEKIGEKFVEQMKTSLESIESGYSLSSDWSVMRSSVALPKPSFAVRGCVDAFKENLPGFVKFLGRTLFSASRIGMSRYFSSVVPVNSLFWDDIWMPAWPGELTFRLEEQLRASGKTILGEKLNHLMVLGLTDAHLLYWVDKVEIEEGGYESCMSLFGSEGSTKLIDALTQQLAIQTGVF